MTSFYRNVVGMKPLLDGATDGWLEFNSGLALHAIPAAIAGGIDTESVREATPIKPVFAVDDVEAEYARLAGLGVRIRRHSWGAADGVDPEGNIFQLCRS